MARGRGVAARRVSPAPKRWRNRWDAVGVGVAGATGRRGRGSARETLGLVAALSCGLLCPLGMGALMATAPLPTGGR